MLVKRSYSWTLLFNLLLEDRREHDCSSAGIFNPPNIADLAGEW
jgi:hypothetical protein